ncbi:YncE family protein [Micromonospora aurantiaca]|uniref:YncE family protein n=1 Tax=Micromonospora aurantiaca (nom. illeg.) TaxID=47850 RepID=A0ABQ6UH93_9ACTN|nr:MULTISPECIES: serine/threonine protein kinase [Micromonospora]ADU07432.1 serine/threonine protein kinase (putative secreted protein) [Micromonospora sp. L5]KAB1114731.1 YncE family protein [Micromonospora aurantiaca]MBC9003630.1 YncE family protein [Micromonospora aurantiaca]OHX03521.1 serine/threonine protein kinase [Micromonospora sp. WMMB235]RNH99048.1 YncE family protein [Micromonospora aurantiaca]
MTPVPQHPSRTRRRAGLAVLAALALVAPAPLVTAPAPAAAAAALQEVMFVGNNWDGTADVIRSRGDYARLGRINVIPDRAARLREIYLNPIKLAFFLGIRQGPGEGHDQLIDDMYTTPDGTALVVSRPSFADVVSIDLATGALRWRFPVSGYRADHMAVSPDGTRVAVSASTSNTVHVLDIRTGAQLGSFGAGDKPHENIYTDGGTRLWNMSIGEVNTDLDAPWLDWTKGDRRITVADTSTYQVVKVIDMRDRLDAAGRRDLSDAVRPAVFTPDGSRLYFQVSFFNGVVEYDVATDRVTRVATLPKNPATSEDRTTWVNDSRHHGLSMSPDGTRICVAGTMDDYATVLDRATLREGPLVPASKPYWATVSGDGRDCVISESGADQVTAINFATGQKVASVPVGDHPQRVRIGHIAEGWTPPAAG